MEGSGADLVLGLDLGSASIGWALVDRAGERVAAAGVRIFPAGVDDAKFEKGQPDASNNVERRRYRLQRRQTRRRARRQKQLFLLLQRHGLLPGAAPDRLPDEAASPERRQHILTELDQNLSTRYREELARLAAPYQVLPYFLRARALDVALSPEELGRVFYHLAQRRGFKSNRRAARSERQEKKQAEADDESTVKSGIRSLQAEMEACGARTLGEFFSRLDPKDPATRIRRRWTGRAMHEAEFDAIWSAQAPYHPGLTGELRGRIRGLLYFQRPVGRGHVGPCELERGEKRAPMASLPAQRFRMLQKLNDLRVVAPDLSERGLDWEERGQLLKALEQEGSLTFAAIKKRKLVSVPRGYHFNLERGGEKTMPGNQTAARMRAVFGDGWDTMDDTQRTAAVDAWVATEDESEFVVLGQSLFGLQGEALDAWNALQLAAGYARFSLVALSKLLPLMEQGVPFATAENAIYGNRFSGGTPIDRLRPVAKFAPALANPAVMRALSELRQLVNAIVREYGKPYEIRIELARDLKRNAKQRKQLSDGMRDQETRRKKIVERVIREAGIPAPGRREIEIGLLWEQSGGLCPYCGQGIGFAQAFNGETADVDHILPRSRFPDDSFGNKALAHKACNNEKAGRTPFEAFGHGDSDRWAQILERVRKWGDATKLRAFQIFDADDLDAANEKSFAARRLNDTRYTSVLAARYLGELYGGRDVARADGTRRRVIHASSGLATATLRRGWSLEGILARHNGKGKNRLDHRHHAVDAVVIALTGNAVIQQLSRAAAADISGQGRISSRTLVAPWPDFADSVRPVIEGIQVSHRPNHRLRGSLHADTIYGGRGDFSHVRKNVHALTKTSVGSIVDPAVARAVQEKLAEVGGDPKKLEGNWPVLRTQRGATIPICKVRIQDRPRAGLKEVGRGSGQRLVSESGNHHVAIFAGRDRAGRERWACQVVSQLEAAQRRARGLSVVSHSWHGEGDFEFLFSLMKDDFVLLSKDGDAGGELLLAVAKFSAIGESGVDLSFTRHDRTHALEEDPKPKLTMDYLRFTSLERLRERACRKVTVDILGRLHEAHD